MVVEMLCFPRKTSKNGPVPGRKVSIARRRPYKTLRPGTVCTPKGGPGPAAPEACQPGPGPTPPASSLCLRKSKFHLETDEASNAQASWAPLGLEENPPNRPRFPGVKFLRAPRGGSNACFPGDNTPNRPRFPGVKFLRGPRGG